MTEQTSPNVPENWEALFTRILSTLQDIEDFTGEQRLSHADLSLFATQLESAYALALRLAKADTLLNEISDLVLSVKVDASAKEHLDLLEEIGHTAVAIHI